MNHPRSEILPNPQLIYLNHAAVGPWPKCTRDAVTQFAEENWQIGASEYPRWLIKEREIRQLAARLINAPSPNDIALLKNTSEALSVVAYGIDWKSGDNIVSCDQEFPSNRIVWESLANQGVGLRLASVDEDDSPEAAIFNCVDERTRLITVSSVQYASGLKLDIEKIGNFCQSRNILFCLDAIQTIGAITLDVQTCHADFVMADGHKWMLGPEGIAIFYSRPSARNQLKLNQFGWHMINNPGDFDQQGWQVNESAQRFECGSPNMLGIQALHASLGYLLDKGMETIGEQVQQNSDFLFQEISRLKGIRRVIPEARERRAGIITFFPTKKDPEQLYRQLKQANIICANRGGGVRFSPHFYHSRNELEQAVSTLDQLLST